MAGNWLRTLHPDLFHSELGLIVHDLEIAGNILSMIVLSKDPNNKLQSVYFNLTSLLAFLLFGLLFSVNEMVTFTHPHLEGDILGSFLSFKWYIFIVLMHMTAMMLIVMSIERWMSLVCPYTVKQHPHTILKVSFVIAAAYLIPFIRSLRSPPSFGGQWQLNNVRSSRSASYHRHQRREKIRTESELVYSRVSKRYHELFTSMVSIPKSDNSRKKTTITDQLPSSITNQETTVSCLDNITLKHISFNLYSALHILTILMYVTDFSFCGYKLV